MSERPTSIDNTFAITPVEQAVAMPPWRYTTTLWQPLANQPSTEKHRALNLLTWLLALGLGGLSAVIIWQFTPLPMDGQVRAIVSGKLLVQDGKGAPWFATDTGRFIRQGARLRAEPGTIALVLFDDGSQLRIESEGEWVCTQLAQSRNTRIKRVGIRQIEGQASYISAPIQPGVDARVVVDLVDIRLLLRGAATVVQTTDQSGQMTIWQGTGEVMAFDQRIAAQSGDQFIHNMHERQIVRTVGVASD